VIDDVCVCVMMMMMMMMMIDDGWMNGLGLLLMVFFCVALLYKCRLLGTCIFADRSYYYNV
jgi:hypothetical protein